MGDKVTRYYEAKSRNFLCPKNLDDVFINGNYNTDSAKNLMIVFEKCDPNERKKKGLKCKTEAEIDDWLLFKYILVLENGIEFV